MGKNKIGGCDITKFGEVTKPSKTMLAAKKAEVLKRTEELKKKNESLKADKVGKVSDIASKFGKKDEPSNTNKLIGILPKPKGLFKVGKKIDKEQVEDNKGDKDKDLDNKGDKVKDLDNKGDKGKDLDNKGTLDNSRDKVKKDEEDKTKDIIIGTNEGGKVIDKPGSKIDGEEEEAH